MNIAVPARTGSWVSGCNRLLDSWRGRLLLGSALAVAYLYAYWTHPALPGADSGNPLGWWGWWDQGQYLKCAAGLSRGSLTPNTYWYPLGYPLLGAFFYRLMPQHLFLIPNLILVVGTGILFYDIARKFISAPEAILLLVVFAVCYRGTTTISLAEPWNTIPTHFLAYLIILVVALRKPNRFVCLFGALCVGLIYLCRPPDAACLGLILPVVILRLPRWRDKLVTGSIAALGLLVFVATVLLINRSIFGSWRTPYEANSAKIGFASYPIGQKLFSLMVDARPIFHLDDTALILHFPWLVLLPPGVVYFIRQGKSSALTVLASIIATYAVYFAYNDFWPFNIFRFHLIHYLFWTLPLLALLTYIGFREAWKDRVGRWSFALILPVVVLVCFVTLKENTRGEISRGESTPFRIPRDGESRLDWILINGASPAAESFAPALGLRAFTGYLSIDREGQWFLLLSKRSRDRPIAAEASPPEGWQNIAYGTLDWRWRRIAYSRPADSNGAIEIVWRKTEDNIDVTGPSGPPDGRADQVIEIALDKTLGQKMAAWDIETTDKRGHWVSRPNSRGWWLIKIAPLDDSTVSDRIRLRLCFPDYGDFDRASAFVLRALDKNGDPLINQTVQK